jgi:hypothetical protein
MNIDDGDDLKVRRKSLKMEMWVITAAEVMQKGFMAKAPDVDATHNQPAVNLNPGDIVFRARPTPWWVRVLYPLVKD